MASTQLSSPTSWKLPDYSYRQFRFGGRRSCVGPKSPRAGHGTHTVHPVVFECISVFLFNPLSPSGMAVRDIYLGSWNPRTYFNCAAPAYIPRETIECLEGKRSDLGCHSDALSARAVSVDCLCLRLHRTAQMEPPASKAKSYRNGEI